MTPPLILSPHFHPASPFAGFGIATLASLWPVSLVQLFGLGVWLIREAEGIHEVQRADNLWSDIF